MTETPGTEDQVLEALAGMPIFSALDDRSRRKLAKLCTLKTYDAGDVLFEEGAIGLSVFVIVSGRAESYRMSDSAKVGLGTVEAGGVLSLPVRLQAPRDTAQGVTVIEFRITDLEEISDSIVEDSRFVGPL